MESPTILHWPHRPRSRSRTARKTGFVIPSFAGNLARPSICQPRHTRRSVCRTKEQYYESRQATVRLNHPMNRNRISIRPIPVRGQCGSIVVSRYPHPAEQIRTPPNSSDRQVPAKIAEHTRKHLKRPERLNGAFPCKTLGIRAGAAPRKKVPRRPETGASARRTQQFRYSVLLPPSTRSRNSTHE